MDSRTRLLDATTALLADRGYHGTGMKDILSASGAVAGSLYHHFPGGKDELAAACVRRAAEDVAVRIERNLASLRLGEAVDAFYVQSAAALRESGFRNGCPVGTPAAETTTFAEPMATAVADAFALWRAALARGLGAHGWPDDEAHQTASLLLSLFEGALLVARAEQSTAPLEVAARHSRALVEGFSSSPRPSGSRPAGRRRP
jgi:TetR/AcrR family transcriptional repressor of lmrAB and yxaGH operons